MKRIAILATIVLLTPAAALAANDATGCTDHPLLSRMPGYWIHSCQNKQFDSFSFFNGKDKPIVVEGQYTRIFYLPEQGAAQKPSELQILRNFQNAVQKLGGKVIAEDKSRMTMKLVQDGKEIWVQVGAEFTGKYLLNIVQKQGMAQDIVADAAALGGDLKSSGHAAIYGIYFDTNKSEVKAESKPALEEIAKLLKQDPSLKLKVVGHTDMVGSVEANMKLSQARGEAVVKALVGQHGIAAARLKGYGVGPLAPVASNDTEDGRAKNRRVELVKE
jgi:outer membrane protein OmpA-like peptidoglycan-associated protein